MSRQLMARFAYDENRQSPVLILYMAQDLSDATEIPNDATYFPMSRDRLRALANQIFDWLDETRCGYS